MICKNCGKELPTEYNVFGKKSAEPCPGTAEAKGYCSQHCWELGTGWSPLRSEHGEALAKEGAKVDAAAQGVEGMKYFGMT